MVVHEGGDRKNTSSWLEKTQSSSNSMTRLVWVIGILLLVIIGGAIGFGIYISHNSTGSSPRALGGSENQGANYTPSASAAAGNLAVSSTAVVHATNTVAKRWPDAWPEPTPDPMNIHAVHKTSGNTSVAKRHLRNKRRLANLH